MLTNELDNKIILDADGNPIPNLTASDILANDLKNTNLNGEHEGESHYKKLIFLKENNWCTSVYTRITNHYKLSTILFVLLL